MQLELADNGQQKRTILDHMLRVMDENGNIIWIREDQLDDNTDEDLYAIVMSQGHLADGLGAFEKMKERKDARLDARLQRQEKKGGSLLQRIGNTAKDVIGTLPGNQGGAPMQNRDGITDYITGGAEIGVNKWYQNPLTLGAIAVLGLGAVYLITRQNSNQ